MAEAGSIMSANDMGDHAENRRHNDVDTGPQGTRVFRRAEISHYVADKQRVPDKPDDVLSGAALVGVDGPYKDRRFDIPAGRSTVGRSSTNNIVIDADSVSLVHARILQKDGEWWVLNLLSTNGTYVNDNKIADSRLHDGDHLRFGDTEFVFRNPEPERTRGFGWILNLAEKLRALFNQRQKA